MQSLQALIPALAAEYDFELVARRAYVGQPETSAWFAGTAANADNRYLDPATEPAPIDALFADPQRRPSMLWLNSFFDREFTWRVLWARRTGKIPGCAVLLTPRGEFAPGALSIKRWRKRAYVSGLSAAGLLQGVWFHATAEHEAQDIARALGRCRPVLVAPNMARWFELPVRPDRSDATDELVLVFLGRVSRVKNLLFALDALHRVRYPVRYRIYGPVEDPVLWNECQARIARLPPHVRVEAHGPIANELVPKTIAAADALLLPTKGENFGHAIHEALMSGLPVIISDQTPWRDLERHCAGWDLPLGDPTRFTETIDTLATMTEAARAELRVGARALAENRLRTGDALAATRRMLGTVLNVPRP
jgi:glycosyltransferase involved in cell wall biosynthesis